MSTLLEITGDHIAELGDADLRDLIGLLCEADYGLAGLPKRGITWGGHQNASDGGLDVVVRGKVLPPVTSFVPRSTTGFQVKTSDMPRNKIIKEMRPNGSLRELIKELLQENGAYIIVSSADSTSETALRDRMDAMKEATASDIGHENFHLDFFDRGRIATWVRSHPSKILWVRIKIGKPLQGWLPHENWARAPGGVEEEYLLDDGLRLHSRDASKGQKLIVEDGLSRLRSVLSVPGKCVRLVGLSGVGKTRLVQALFDDRVGKDALDRSLAIYTDMSSSPEPAPVALANQLIDAQTRAILMIIDNCAPDLHHSLVNICSKKQSNVSLLTIEYDVRDDIPEETSVFRLESVSENIIEKLISERYAHISQVNARKIANLSGGNARVAIALAGTVEKGETLSGFCDEHLFERLFQQRHTPDNTLLISAQACSLVYSFEGTDTDSDNSEIKFLASLVDKSPADLYRDISELKRRDLIQSRGVWRAVLPHAIANRLARHALESIPKDTLVKGVRRNSERIIRSFTRRLSYLHDCKAATDIVNDWLDQDGWIGQSINNLNSLEINVLNNIAPVLPLKTLAAIERAANGSDGNTFTSRNNSQSSEFVGLLRHLAYDPALFGRSVELLCRFALSEDKHGNNNSIRGELKSLFYIYLSGTHAPMEARVKVIEKLMDSEDQDKQELGLLLLDAALESRHFSSAYKFGFGVWSRDYGYCPKTQEEITHWFNTAIGICMRVALSGRLISPAKKLLAKKLRGLWTEAHMYDALEESAKKIREQGAWNDGWITVCRILRHDSKDFDDRERLYKLRKLLEPDSLLEKVRAFVFSDLPGFFDSKDDFYDKEEATPAGYRRDEEPTRRIGYEVAQDAETLNALLPDIVSTDNARLFDFDFYFDFGIGLAEGTGDKKSLFQALYDALEKTSPEKREITVFLGFLSSCEKSAPSFYNSTLDDLVKDELMGKWFLDIQTFSIIDQRGVKRLHEALDHGKVEIHSFQSRQSLARCVCESISDDDAAGLLKKILLKEGGVNVALYIILQRQFHKKEKELSKYSDGLIAVARDVMMAFSFDDEGTGQNNHDDELAKMVSLCLDGTKGSHAATIMCQNFAKAISRNGVDSFNFPQLLTKLAKVQPTIFLDVFLEGDGVEDHQPQRMFSDNSKLHNDPLNQISDIDLLSWCEKDPSSRYPLVASTVTAIKQSDETGKYEWEPFVYTILDKAPVLEDVLKRFADSLRKMLWDDSKVDILKRLAVLYPGLYKHDNEEVAAWAKSQYTELQEEIREEIRKEREWENQENHERNERFE